MLAVIATFIQSTLLLPNLPSHEHAHQTTSLKLCHQPIALPSTKGLFVTHPKPAWSFVINPSLCHQLYHKGSFRHTPQTSPSAVETSWHQQSLQWRPTCSCHHQAFQPGFLKFKTTPLGFLRITTQSIKEPLQALQPDTFTIKREKKKKVPASPRFTIHLVPPLATLDEVPT